STVMTEARDYRFLGRAHSSAVTSRAVSIRLRAWSAAAGVGRVTRSARTAARAVWLSSEGVDDPRIQIAMGRRSVRSVDAMLAPYRRHANQTAVQAVLETQLYEASLPDD